MIQPVRLGGVPEHVNYPWHLGLELGDFRQSADQPLDLAWTDYSTGTGAMVSDLENNQLDMAVLLSEGAVAAISAGVGLKMLTWTVSSPLLWGVHVSPKLKVAELSELRQPRIAISRFGSGSHLMAHVLMHDRNLSQAWSGHEFVVVDNMPGAAEAFARDQADLFMWEKFTTQPMVDQGAMRRIDICPTPWPPFCLVTSQRFLDQSPDVVSAVAKTYHRCAARADRLPDIVSRIAASYQLQEDQIEQWRSLTAWNLELGLGEPQVANIIQQLAGLDLASADLKPDQCIETL